MFVEPNVLFVAACPMLGEPRGVTIKRMVLMLLPERDKYDYVLSALRFSEEWCPWKDSPVFRFTVRVANKRRDND